VISPLTFSFLLTLLFSRSFILLHWRIKKEYIIQSFHISRLIAHKETAMPLVPSSAPLPSSMTTFAYLREQKILNIVYVGLLVVEVLMVLGVISVALVKRVKAHRRPKTIRPVTPLTNYPPHQYMHIGNEKTTTL
jgi:hypothetical protein